MITQEKPKRKREENPVAGGYVLITPAKNEAAFIEQTLLSMATQTVKPIKWVIVSDGSTDGTDDLVRRYAVENQWIELVRAPERTERHFAGKVQAFNFGYERVRNLPYDFIGSLDGDMSFDREYFEFLLSKLLANPRLGLAGTPFRETQVSYDYRFVSIEHVSGACQLFRRECFEAIGGYVPVKGGGIDLIAVMTARMKGWETRTFQEKVSIHHRNMGSAKYGVVMTKFKDGQKDYVLGGHPVWEMFRWGYQMSRKPYVVGGCALLGGYLWNWMRRAEKTISPELMKFRQAEQMMRLKRFFLRAKVPQQAQS